jgi:hypothetical protein
MARLDLLCVQIAVMSWRVSAINLGMSGMTGAVRYARSFEAGQTMPTVLVAGLIGLRP